MKGLELLHLRPRRRKCAPTRQLGPSTHSFSGTDRPLLQRPRVDRIEDERKTVGTDLAQVVERTTRRGAQSGTGTRLCHPRRLRRQSRVRRSSLRRTPARPSSGLVPGQRGSVIRTPSPSRPFWNCKPVCTCSYLCLSLLQFMFRSLCPRSTHRNGACSAWRPHSGTSTTQVCRRGGRGAVPHSVRNQVAACEPPQLCVRCSSPRGCLHYLVDSVLRCVVLAGGNCSTSRRSGSSATCDPSALTRLRRFAD